MATRNKTGDRRRRGMLAAAAALLCCGLAAVAVGCGSQDTPPQPSGSAQHAQPAAAPKGQILPKSTPVAISIKAIDVRSKLQQLGLNDDGTVEVPQMGPHYNEAGWYKYSPTPGEQGPSVILGHIDSKEKGPSVFFRLGDMKKGDKVSVTRKDGTVAVFTVYKTEEYPKANFPTKKVYGNTSNAQLRLISCGGPFDEQKASYKDDIVVYANLTGSHPA